jgi:hypothetical protein
VKPHSTTPTSPNEANRRVRPVFDHLDALTDERGLFEHALFTAPRPEHGYCLDDAARGLVVTSRETGSSSVVARLHERYLGFVLMALDNGGACHNRMRPDGTWHDEAGVGDWWGRATWGLGVAAVRSPTASQRARALAGFRVAAQQRSPFIRAMAFAALGAGEVLRARPGDPAARGLLGDAVSVVDPPVPGRRAIKSRWPWPEPRLRYANAVLAEALIVAGDTLPNKTVRSRGLELLAFLLRVEIYDQHLSVTPVAGRGPNELGPGFDQQPIEIATIADACATAYRVSTDPRWLIGINLAWRWFLGDNDARTPMFDPATGGGYDGLHADGPNLNQGAESTLAMLSTAQHARHVQGLR